MAKANSRETSRHNDMSEHTQQDDHDMITPDDDVSLGDTIFQRHEEEVPAMLTDNTFLHTLKNEYTGDKLFQVVLESPEDYREFLVQNVII
jgi:hypothetical protein